MGLSNFPSPAEGGVIPLLVMNTVMSVALVKNKLRLVIDAVSGAVGSSGEDTDYNNSGTVMSSSEVGVEEEEEEEEEEECCSTRERRVSITRYSSLCKNRDRWCEGCSVCLSRFKGEEEVSELSCKHFFHKGCLDKWFDNHHITCPLCRSIA